MDLVVGLTPVEAIVSSGFCLGVEFVEIGILLLLNPVHSSGDIYFFRII